MKRPKSGVLCLAALALTLSACRKDPPPPIMICVLDGVGGADCVDKLGAQVYLPPSKLKNFWATSEEDMQAFSGWCYGASTPDPQPSMSPYQKKVQAPDALP